MLLVTVVAAAVTVASVLWSFHDDHERTTGWWTVVVAGTALAAAGFAAIRGCFVEVSGEEVRDVVAWVTVRRVLRSAVGSARVARGVWRLFVLELDDGRRVPLLGASPQQWPARLLPGARERDLADLDTLLGDP